MKLRDFKIDNNEKMTLMGGMNVLESRDLAMEVAEKFKNVTDKNGINYIFKGSFDKANRSSISSYRGPGLDEGLKILEEISKTYDIPVITDIHEPNQAKSVSEICEVIQIPAFLKNVKLLEIKILLCVKEVTHMDTTIWLLIL